MVLWTLRLHFPNNISIGSSVLDQLIVVVDTETHRHTNRETDRLTDHATAVAK